MEGFINWPFKEKALDSFSFHVLTNADGIETFMKE